jgi:hypothetical protein
MCIYYCSFICFVFRTTTASPEPTASEALRFARVSEGSAAEATGNFGNQAREEYKSSRDRLLKACCMNVINNIYIYIYII